MKIVKSKPKIALAFRPSIPQIKALSDKLSFGKYKGWKIEDIISLDANYILWLEDEKIAKVSETILKYADEAETDQRLSEAIDGELDGMRFWDIYNDD